MLTILALVVGFAAGFYTNDHFKATVAAVQADVKKELDAIKQKLGV